VGRIRPTFLFSSREQVRVLSVNLKTAKALGLTIPQSVLMQAEDNIQ
jgi:hypothetical protein